MRLERLTSRYLNAEIDYTFYIYLSLTFIKSLNKKTFHNFYKI